MSEYSLTREDFAALKQITLTLMDAAEQIVDLNNKLADNHHNLIEFVMKIGRSRKTNESGVLEGYEQQIEEDE